MLLDDIVPTWDVSSRHTIWISANPAEVYLAARQADLGRPWLVRVLMTLRAVPASLATLFQSHRRTVNSRIEESVAGLPFTADRTRRAGQTQPGGTIHY